MRRPLAGVIAPVVTQVQTPAPVITPQAMYAMRGYDDTAVQLCAGPAYHAAPLAFDIRAAMGAGATLVFLDKWDSEATLRTMQAMLRSAKSQHRGAKAAAGLSADSLGDSRMVSPLAGTVTKREIHMGTRVVPGTVAFEIQDIDELELVGAVTARDFARLELGQKVEIRVDARPDETFEGTVKTLSPSLDPVTRRATIEVSVANPDHRLLPNQFADATVVVERRTGVLAVPRDAVVPTPDGPDLYTVRDGVAVLVHAKLGATEDAWVPVLEGLAEGAPVIVAGHAELRDGLPVVVVEDEGPKQVAVRSNGSAAREESPWR